jgi:oxaloacetate decarboxylase alpha subunit
LQQKVLDGKQPITCRPADLLEPEMEKLTQELLEITAREKISLEGELIDNVLIYALFPQIGLKYLKNRHDPTSFEPAPQNTNPNSTQTVEHTKPKTQAVEHYSVKVNGKTYQVSVAAGGAITAINEASNSSSELPNSNATVSQGETVKAPLAGNIFKIKVKIGEQVEAGQTLLILEAMKMETEVKAAAAGVVSEIYVAEGDAVKVGTPLIAL